MSTDKPIVISVTILPLKDGKRKVLVDGAPQGEMPVAARGVFAEMHHLIDQVWMTLNTREAQVVTMKEDKKTRRTEDELAEARSEMVTEVAGKLAESDQLVTEEVAQPVLLPPDELPVIESLGTTEGE